MRVVRLEDELLDPDLVPDPWVIAGAVPEAMADLMSASGLGEATPVADPFAVRPTAGEGATAPPSVANRSRAAGVSRSPRQSALSYAWAIARRRSGLSDNAGARSPPPPPEP